MEHEKGDFQGFLIFGLVGNPMMNGMIDFIFFPSRTAMLSREKLLFLM